MVPHEPKEVCTEIPPKYVAASNKQTNALGSTYLELTWDQTDPNRVEMCKRAFNEQQLNTMDLDAYLQGDDAITDAGFDTDYPVTEYDTDTPDKKVLIKRRARNRYKDLLNEFKEMERTLKGSDEETDGMSTDTERTDNEFGINVVPQQRDSVEDGIKAFRERLQQKEKQQTQRLQEMRLRVDNLSSTSSEGEGEGEGVGAAKGHSAKDGVVGDQESTFNLDDEASSLNAWIDTQKRLKQTMRQSPGEEGLEVNAKKRSREEFESEREEEEEEEPLVVPHDMTAEERQDPFFQNVHDSTYLDSAEPAAKRQRVRSQREQDEAEKERKQRQIEERAKLEMMMASENVQGSYDPEDTEMDPEELSQKLDRRLAKNWRLRRKIKKAVKRKLAEQDQFEFDAEDERFSALTEDPEFAMDPTSTAFRNSDAMKQLLAATRRKRGRLWGSGKEQRDKLKTKKMKESASSIETNTLIHSLKLKTAKIPRLIDGQKRRQNITRNIKRKGLSAFDSDP